MNDSSDPAAVRVELDLPAVLVDELNATAAHEGGEVSLSELVGGLALEAHLARLEAVRGEAVRDEARRVPELSGLAAKLRRWVGLGGVRGAPSPADVRVVHLDGAALRRAFASSAETALRDASGLGRFLRTCARCGPRDGGPRDTDAHAVLSMLVGCVVEALRAGEGDPAELPAWLLGALTIEPASPAFNENGRKA